MAAWLRYVDYSIEEKMKCPSCLTLFLLIASIVLTPRASAGTAGGTVNFLLGVNSGHFLFDTTGKQAQPACADSGWAIDASTPGGKIMAALLIAAQAQGKHVDVVGAGNCDMYGGRETVIYVVVS